jgi:integrase
LINIDQGTVQELQKQHKRIQQYKKENPEFKDYDLVVSTKNGTPFIPTNALRRYYILVRNANVPKISFHDLRHTHDSLLLKQDIHPKIVSERLGHADVRITLDTYSHLLPGLQEETAEKIGEMLFG